MRIMIELSKYHYLSIKSSKQKYFYKDKLLNILLDIILISNKKVDDFIWILKIIKEYCIEFPDFYQSIIQIFENRLTKIEKKDSTSESHLKIIIKCI